MKDSNKKIFAREFLFLLGTIILFLVVFFAWVMLHNSNDAKESELKQKIENLSEHGKLPYRLRVFANINERIIKSSLGKMKDRAKFISDLKDYEFASKTYDYIKENDDVNISKEEFLTEY